MPLYVGNTPLDNIRSVADLVRDHPSLAESAVKLCNTPVVTHHSEGVLYVYQLEMGATTPDDQVVKVIGSEDATTCHIAVLRNSGSGATCLAHFDGTSTGQGVGDMLQSVLDLSEGGGAGDGVLELHLVGGFHDDKRTSEKLSLELLNAFDQQLPSIQLVTACISDLNDAVRDGVHRPVVYGVGVEVDTGVVAPAKFADKGPDVPIRSARLFTGTDKSMRNVYDPVSRLFRIEPFGCLPWPEAPLWLQQPDRFLLRHLSTSPAVEPPDFVRSLRQTLVHLIENPHPHRTVFPAGAPRLYRKNGEGKWQKI